MKRNAAGISVDDVRRDTAREEHISPGHVNMKVEIDVADDPSQPSDAKKEIDVADDPSQPSDAKKEIDVADDPSQPSDAKKDMKCKNFTDSGSFQQENVCESAVSDKCEESPARPGDSGWSLRVSLKEEIADPGYDHYKNMQGNHKEAHVEVSQGSHKEVQPEPKTSDSSTAVAKFKCELCSATFLELSSLKGHSRRCRGQKSYKYKCGLCSEEFGHFSILKQHMDSHIADGSVPSKEEPSSQSSCEAFCEAENPASLVENLCGENSYEEAESSFREACEEETYRCKYCPAVFAWPFQLKAHMSTHKGEKGFKCSTCPAAFKSNSNLKEHLRTHSGEKPFKCEDCDAAFARANHLKRHSLTHSGEKPYKCSLCTASFRQSADLTRHVMIHTGVKPYKCERCSASFVRSWELKVHFRTHTGEKPYKCEHCPSAFTVQSALKTHVRLHSGEKPYTCKYCPAAYTQSANLKCHMKKHNGHTAYRCGLCTSVFLDSRNLQNHVFLLHNVEKIHLEQSIVKTEPVELEESTDLNDGVKQ